MRKKNKSKKLITILAVFIIIAAVFIYYILSAENHSIYVSVNDPSDDSRTFISGQGAENEDGKWATLQLAPTYSFGVRFSNLSIPKNAKIVKAYIEVYSIGTPGHQSPNCKIYCDDTANAGNFTDKIGVLNTKGRNYTVNYARWNTTAPYGKWVKTPSLVDPLQEVISHKNWEPGNAAVFLFVSEGLRGYSATFQNYEAGYPARLYVEWE